jgi:hypothetical protein
LYFLEGTERENAEDAGEMLRYTWETGILLRKTEKEESPSIPFIDF